MCKAGFAGDDAPRAVFRKSRFDKFPNLMLLRLEIKGLTFVAASIVGRPRHHGYDLPCAAQQRN